MNSTHTIDIVVEEPPLVKREKHGRWEDVVNRIASEHDGEWVRVMTTFKSSKEARAAITSMQASAKKAGKTLTGAVRTNGEESRIWVQTGS